MSGKRLKDLKVSELKEHLEDRDLDTSGKKSDLVERLKGALIQEGVEDFENYVFRDQTADLLSKIEMQTLKLKHQLVENSSVLTNQLMENSSKLENKLMENSSELRNQIMENSSRLENKMIEKLENKLMENSANLRDEMSELMNENLSKFNEKLEGVKQEVNDVKQEMNEVLENVEKKVREEVEKLRLEFESQTYSKDPERHNVQGEHKNNDSVVIPVFDGKTPWNEFWTLFETAALVNSWTEGQKASKLSLALRGDALRILQTIPLLERTNFKELVSRLEMRFGEKHLIEMYRSELRNRAQKEKESLQEYEADIVRLVKIAYPTAPDDIYESLAVDKFLDGIRDVETKQAVKLARPRTINDALAQALEFEAIRKSSRGFARVRVIDADANSEEKPTLKIEEIVEQVLKALESRKRQPRCWNCGKIGHIRSRCQQPPKANNSKQEN